MNRDPGPFGAAGREGLRGGIGDNGLEGLPGLQGLPGKKGPVGFSGLPGPRGPQGLAGAEGPDGKDAPPQRLAPRGFYVAVHSQTSQERHSVTCFVQSPEVAGSSGAFSLLLLTLVPSFSTLDLVLVQNRISPGSLGSRINH